MVKEWYIRGESMATYCAVVGKLEGIFQGLELTHASRVENEVVASLAKLGFTRLPIRPGIFLQQLHESSIHEKPYGNQVILDSQKPLWI